MYIKPVLWNWQGGDINIYYLGKVFTLRYYKQD